MGALMRLPCGTRLTVKIDSLAFRGQGVARTPEGLVVFVNGALPGEVAMVEIVKAKNRYREANVRDLFEPSKYRKAAPCLYFGDCGGCSWQYLEYAGQLEAKRSEVIDSFSHIGKFKDIIVAETMGMAEPWHYRNRMDFSFADQGGRALIGLHRRQAFDQIVPTSDCLIVNARTTELISTINDWSDRYHITAYQTGGTGQLRTAILRFGLRTGQAMLNLVTTSAMAGDKSIKDLADSLGIDSFWHTINDSKNDSSYNERYLIKGQPSIKETVLGLTFSVSVGSFFQTNTEMAEKLYQIIIEDLADTDLRSVLDLYSGTGTIALALARQCGGVIGIESAPESVFDAQANALANGITNVQFVCAQVESGLEDVLHENPNTVAAVLNPPRAGLHPKTCKSLSESLLRRLIYVSCNPTTLARDCLALCESGFSIAKVQPVDMFPHTYHVETVCCLFR